MSGKLYLNINSTHHYCSGVFVDDNIIVTAAHCVQQNGTTTKYQIEKFVKERTRPTEDFLSRKTPAIKIASSCPTSGPAKLTSIFGSITICLS